MSAFQTKSLFEAAKETNGVELSLCYEYTHEQYKIWWTDGAEGDDKHTAEEQLAV